MKKLIILIMICFPVNAYALTWGEIEFLPKEPFWDEELNMYLIGDSFNLLILDPEEPGLAKVLQLSCALDEFGDNPNALFFDVSILFRGMGADALPVATNDEDVFLFEGEPFPVRIITPAGETSGTWGWVKYEADYVSGSPPVDQPLELSYEDLKHAPWVRVIALGQDFTLDMSAVQAYFQGFERQCAEIMP